MDCCCAAAPVVSTTSAANTALSGRDTVTIGGLSFGVAGPTATASLSAADVCGSSAWTSATTVACAPQAYGGTAGVRTAVSVSGVAGTATGQLSFDGACAVVGWLCIALRRPCSFVHAGWRWDVYVLVPFCSSCRVFIASGECSGVGSSAGHHLRLAFWAVRTFGHALARKRLVLHDKLDLGYLGGLHKRVKRRRPSEWSSNRRCRNCRHGVIYSVRCLSDTLSHALSQSIADAEVRPSTRSGTQQWDGRLWSGSRASASHARHRHKVGRASRIGA